MCSIFMIISSYEWFHIIEKGKKKKAVHISLLRQVEDKKLDIIFEQCKSDNDSIKEMCKIMDIIRISSLVYLLFRVTGLILCICLIRNLSVAFLPRRFRKKKTQEQENLLGNDDYQTKNLLLYFFICIILNVIGFCAMIIWPIIASLHSKTIIL